jgi:signal peptidase
MAIMWFSPVLPNLSWGTEALLGVMVPTLSFLAINQFIPPATLRRLGISTEVRGFGKAVGKKFSMRFWIIVPIVCLLGVWVMTGFLGFQPATVISGSMSPTMDVGDVAIVQKVSANSIKPGDIIQYWKEGGMVIHRVIDVQDQGGTKLFITKGDANAAPDVQPVHPSQIKGKLVLTIPKVGWIPIAFKSFISGAWSFLTANVALAYAVLTTALGACIFYAIRVFRSRPAKRWRSPIWRGEGGPL